MFLPNPAYVLSRLEFERDLLLMSWDESEFHAELSWCPECQAPSNAEYAHVRYCDMHMPTQSGLVDHVVGDPEYIARGEAGGESNVAVCAFFHRSKGE